MLKGGRRILVVVTLLFLLNGCRRNPEAARRPEVDAPAVEAVPARQGALPLQERVSGTVWAENQVELFPEVSGRVTRVHVRNGERVLSGQPLVQIDDRQYQEQVRQAEAGHRIAAAQLRQAEARRQELLSQSRRTRALGELVTEVERETLAAQVQAAEADVELAEAQLEQAAATLAQRQDQLARTVIRAPIDGVVGQRNAEIGLQVTPTSRLFVIGQIERMRVRVNLTDRMLRYIEPGQPVRIHAPTARGTQPITASLSRVSPFLHPVTRSAEAEIDVDEHAGRLRPGMFVAVDILYGQSAVATLVPTSALFTDRNTGREGVFVIEAGFAPPAATAATAATEEPTGPPPYSDPVNVEFRRVDIIARGAQEAAVAALEPGEWIVTLGQDLLATGRNQARIRSVSWDHVLGLQGLRREDLLQRMLRASAEPNPSSP
jgi:HlyD family secretion protein